jgi:hypothetical protein
MSYIHGHAPGHIRDEFCEALEAFADTTDNDPDIGEAVSRLFTAAGKVWRCTDILPGDVYATVRDCCLIDRFTPTYAGAARRVREFIAYRYEALAKPTVH